MPVQAAIFDLDGTLLDTLGDLAASGNAVLSRRNLPVHPPEDYRFFIGDGMRNLVRRIFPEDANLSEAELNLALADYKSEYGDRWNETTRAYEGIPELLDKLADRGIPLGVLSNKAHAFTKKCVEEFLGDWKWDIVLGQREGVPPKPDPAAALEAAGTLGIPPESCVFLGDSGVDMKTAVNAGMRAAGVLWGFRSRDELEGAGARFLVQHPSEVLALLDR